MKIKEPAQNRQKNYKIRHDLTERIKELHCHYGMSKLIEHSDLSLEEIFKRTLKLLISAWQFPDVTCCRISFDEKVFKTKNFQETSWRQSSVIKAGGINRGIIEVCYLKKRPEAYEGPFLKEERNLLDIIAERLGLCAHKKQMEEQLSQKNAALREIIAQIEREKNEIKEAVHANIDRVLIPILHRIKKRVSKNDRSHFDFFEENLKQITDSFSVKAGRNHFHLSPREIEICELIKNGLSIKEIADLLTLSFHSVVTHRRNVRKKLGITNERVNLVTYLKQASF